MTLGGHMSHIINMQKDIWRTSPVQPDICDKVRFGFHCYSYFPIECIQITLCPIEHNKHVYVSLGMKSRFFPSSLRFQISKAKIVSMNILNEFDNIQSAWMNVNVFAVGDDCDFVTFAKWKRFFNIFSPSRPRSKCVNKMRKKRTCSPFRIKQKQFFVSQSKEKRKPSVPLPVLLNSKNYCSLFWLLFSH